MSMEFTMDTKHNMWDYADAQHRSGLYSFDPVIVGCAITGANQGKEANPGLPETVEEQVESAKEAVAAGAVMLHIHARDPKNTAMMSQDPEMYKEVNRKIREACPDVIINNTMGCGCSVVDGKRGPMAMTSLTADPEVGSIDTTCYCSYVKLPARPGVRDEAVFRELIYTMTQPEAEKAVQQFAEHGIKPEFECFALSDFYYLNRLIASGYKDPMGGPFWVNFVFTAGSNWPDPDFVNTVVRHCPRNSVLQLSGTGAQQWSIVAQAIVHGAHIRVGMEDNIYYAKGRKAKSNGELVEKAVRMAHDLDRPVATVEQARKMLGLGAPRKY